MKRRDFVKCGILASTVTGMAGCSVFNKRTVTIQRHKPAPTAEWLKVTRTRPQPGTIPMGDLGSTGIKVSKFAFGSHLPITLVPHEKERESLIREALDSGITTFDVYNREQRCYQYEPMGRYLKDVINDVVISISMSPDKGRSIEEEFHYDLKAFGRDYIDMVRSHAYFPDNENKRISERWKQWEYLFKFKEQGKIRAVGVPIHFERDLDYLLKVFPNEIDFVILPYNFYHNLLYTGELLGDYDPLGKRLKDKGIGVIVMKSFGSEWFISHLIEASKKFNNNAEVSLPQAMLRYIINSGLDPDTTFAGMWCMNDLYENLPAYFNPRMTDEEVQLLDKMRKYISIQTASILPEHYRFLEAWAPSSESTDGRIRVASC